MKGIILKDIYGVKKLFVSILAMVGMYLVICFFMDSPDFLYGMMAGLTAVLSILLPITCFNNDKAYEWDVFGLSLPVTRRQIVLARYAVSLLFVAVSVLSGTLMGLIALLFRGGDPAEFGYSVGGSALVGVALLAVFLPLLYRFGAEKSRFVFIVIGLGGFLVGTLLSKTQDLFHVTISLPDWFYQSLWVTLPVIVVLLFCVSFLISCRFYSKKDVES